jgi:hypothetical protein
MDSPVRYLDTGRSEISENRESDPVVTLPVFEKENRSGNRKSREKAEK